jgi:tubulin alpha
MSGLVDRLLERGAIDFGKKTQVLAGVFPSKKGNVVTQDYNCILSFMGMHDHLDLTMMYQNSSLYKLCQQHLGIESPAYSDINQLIAHHISSLHASTRLASQTPVPLSTTATNLVPYPRLHLTIPHLAPFVSVEKSFQGDKPIGELT